MKRLVCFVALMGLATVGWSESVMVEGIAAHVNDTVITKPATSDDETSGDWSDGRYAWEAIKPRVLETPIPWRGMQGFFNVPDDIVNTLPPTPSAGHAT